MRTKICKDCKVEKPLEESFSRHSGTKDGFFNKCKACTNITRKITRKVYDNTEKAKLYRSTYNKIYYIENKDIVDAKNKRWAKENVERVKAYERQRWKITRTTYSRHLEEKARLRAYAKANIQKWNLVNAERRALKLKAVPLFGIENEFNALVLQEAYELARRRSMLTGFKWHVDHVVPLKSDMVCGFHVYTNLDVIPAQINLSKSNRYWLDQWT